MAVAKVASVTIMPPLPIIMPLPPMHMARRDIRMPPPAITPKQLITMQPVPMLQRLQLPARRHRRHRRRCMSTLTAVSMCTSTESGAGMQKHDSRRKAGCHVLPLAGYSFGAT